MTIRLNIAKTKFGAMIPSKREGDAGYDIYACFDENYMTILPHETKLVPTGIATSFPKEYVAIIKERGSTGTKGMGQRCGVIDSNFRGEWFVPITNHNDVPMFIVKQEAEFDVEYAKHSRALVEIYKEAKVYPYDKAIAQFIMLPVPEFEVVEVFKEDIENDVTDRGTGALGSSGK